MYYAIREINVGEGTKIQPGKPVPVKHLEDKSVLRALLNLGYIEEGSPKKARKEFKEKKAAKQKAAPKKQVQEPEVVVRRPRPAGAPPVEEPKVKLEVKAVTTEHTDGDKTTFTCLQCNKSFNSKRGLGVHLNRAH